MNPSRVILLLGSLAPFAALHANQTQKPPLAEEVYKNVKVFKGVPASDMIPAMEFMSASLGYKCVDCHDPKDYALDIPKKEESRKMVLMQREINDKHFGGKLEVTCYSCHGGKDHPAGMPLPEGVSMRHERIETELKPADFFAKHAKALGKNEAEMSLSGKLTAPDDATHEIKTEALTILHGSAGKYRVDAGARKFGFDGAQTWYGEYPMADEPAAIFNRIGRSWRGETAFAGLERLTVSGSDVVAGTPVTVVRGVRTSTASTEELYFDQKTGLLLRAVNAKRSTIGTVISSIDYSDYKSFDGTLIATSVKLNFGSGDTWTIKIESAKASKTPEAKFKIGG